MKKKIFLLFVLFVGQSFAIVTGQALVDEARNWIGYPYIWGDPPNKNWTGQKGFDGLYWYGWVFEMSQWQGGFDCSGLVSYCAGLRRHFRVSEFRDFGLFGAGRPFWEVAEPGDLIPNKDYGHIRILSVNKPDSAKIYFIHAPRTGLPVKEESKSYDDLIEDEDHAYLFWDDHTGPEIIVIGVKDGGVYSPPVNFNYLVNDPNEPLWSVFFEGNFQKETKLTETGDYTLRIFAKDWAMNESNKIIHFKIVGPPQVIFTDPSQGEENVDIYDFRKQKQKGIGDEFNFEVVFNKPMDTVSVCQAIRVINIDNDSSEVNIKNIYWYDDRTILVRKFDLSFINRKNNKGV
jgi:hypothetical protein